ncbi:MAG: glycoside hydrolase family 3 protein [Alphaproteobacteria bacterium]|nr:glycoside hydrolase family 3 protein [Alphaproteobacteria bacterium]
MIGAYLSQMSLEEKMALIRGEVEPPATNQGQAGYLTGVPRLRIPPLRFADGPPGVLTHMQSPALTATMGLAATFSRADARDNGVVIGDEADRLGIDVTLQPFINIDRDLTFERGYNTYGEDPVLTGAIGAELIKGIQSRGVMAQAKHYVGYDSEAENVSIDDQALHEVYLAPFDDAVKAGVASIMCAYNRIDGPYACGNRHLLIDVLRDHMGFKGFVTSDWGAVHDYDFIGQGVDMEMPGRPAKGDPYAFYTRSFFDTEPPRVLTPPDLSKLPPVNIFTGTVPEEPAPSAPFELTIPSGAYKNLWTALQEGVVTPAVIDRAAGDVLRQLIRFGYLNGTRAQLLRTPSGVDSSTVIQRTSEDAAVLLKNEGILPLAAQKSGTIAMIGPGAAQVVAIGISGERSVGIAERQVGPYEALRKTVPDADIRLEVANDMTGRAVPPSALSHGNAPGLLHAAAGIAAGVDPQIAFTHAAALPAGTSHVWTGTLTIPAAGRYIVALQSLGARGLLQIDGKIIAMTSGSQGSMHGDVLYPGQDDLMPTRDGLNNARGAAELGAGPHLLRIEANPDGSNAPVQIRFAWVTPEEQLANFQAAVAAAKSAQTAVVFVWSRGQPIFTLPGDQNRLVEAVAAVNPNTIVVLNVSQPVAMPWLDKVRAVLQMWWPGDEGGWATANVLAGVRNPAGRLPFTWARQLTDYAATDPAHPERAGSSPDGKATFSEGVDVGYRWFERTGTPPLYPFGYGLSYTRFSYSRLRVVKTADGGLDVRFRVTNTGSVDGEEVPQVYLSAPRRIIPGVQFAPKALAGFDRAMVKTGTHRDMTIHVERRRLQYWSTRTSSWIDAAATRTLWVAASSKDMRLEGTLH